MDAAYRVVHLMKNRLYPTYQLHAYMANKKTAAQDGLRLAALVTMNWLARRIGDDIPEILQRVPDASDYLQATDDDLPSLHINAGYIIDIVSLPKDGTWTLQIAEPDLGSDPGNAQQSRKAVPGRVIETNIEFRIVGSRLECGFQTVISDPEGTSQEAEVYRLAIIRQLAGHPDFGLKQITPLCSEPLPLKTSEQVKNMFEAWKSAENQIPCVIFTHARSVQAPTQLPSIHTDIWSSSPALIRPELQQKPTAPTPEMPYDVSGFAKSSITFCRTYIADNAIFEKLSAQLPLTPCPGDIIVLEPPAFGGKARAIPLKPNATRRKEQIDALKLEMCQYLRNRHISFGRIAFLSAARKDLLQHTQDTIHQAEESSGLWEQKLEETNAHWKGILQEKESAYNALSDQIDRLKQYQAQLEAEKDALRQDLENAHTRVKHLLDEKDDEIAYLKRKLGQPKDHIEIANWVKANFGGKLLLHQKAENLLTDKNARSVDLELICDALDFLATDYWDRRYANCTTDEMNTRCSRKYGRPFEVKPVGDTTIEYTPVDYKIKYFIGAKGKPVESALNFHLCVGNAPENLLRIYFLHDDDKKLIVVGSLPRHLKAVKIK